MSEDWIYGRLDGIARIDRGASWGKSQEVADDSGTPVIRIANVQPEGLELSDIRLVADIKLRDIERSMIGPNTLLMVGSNGNPERIGNVYAPDSRTEGLVLASFLIGLHARDPLTAQWLFYWLSSEVTQKLITDSTAGSTGLKNMSLEWLRSISVPIPTLPVQRRIVDLMTHLDAHIANLQAEGYACGVLLAALRLKIFTESRVRPRRLDEIVELIIDNRGKTPKKLGTEFTSTGCPVLSAVNVKDGFIVPSTEPRFIDDATYRRWMKNPTMKGDVLLTSEGPLGQVAQVPDEKPWVLGQRLFALRGAPNQLLNDYLMHFLSSELGQAALVQRSSGSTVRGIRQSELVQVLVPWIPIGHQMAVSGAMNGVVANLRALEVEVGRLRALRTAMTSTLLTGLVVIPEIYDNCIREVA